MQLKEKKLDSSYSADWCFR